MQKLPVAGKTEKGGIEKALTWACFNNQKRQSMKNEQVTIKAPNMATAQFDIRGTAPLVIHRFSQKVQNGFLDKIKSGSTPRGKTRHEATDPSDVCEAAKYHGETNGEKWEGFNASSIRCALISACRLVNFKMTLAKLSVFVLEDGRDVVNPLYPLIRIDGKSERTEMIARTETGVAMLTIRPMYFPWAATIRLRFDNDQFTVTDVSNLLARAGEQVGIGEGRPDSKNSAGMGWGLFEIINGKGK